MELAIINGTYRASIGKTHGVLEEQLKLIPNHNLLRQHHPGLGTPLIITPPHLISHAAAAAAAHQVLVNGSGGGGLQVPVSSGSGHPLASQGQHLLSPHDAAAVAAGALIYTRAFDPGQLQGYGVHNLLATTGTPTHLLEFHHPNQLQQQHDPHRC